jgi:YidC/Oxa1 family membrane protein insertase
VTQVWHAIEFGLGAAVSFFYGLIPNLGVAIILLTIAVGAVLFPLTLKQTRSMRAMQQMQPELKRLQKEYAGDKQGLQQATLALYKERGVNPAAGCLPLLLQMPIWFALFQVLRSFAAADPTQFVLPGSRLFGEIQGWVAAGQQANPVWRDFLWMDLGTSPSQAFRVGWVHFIPYVVTVLLVMGTAWYQQVQTMAKAKDGQPVPQQPGQAVMKIFPIFFGFISFSLPAGLVVYFAASQIFRIGQQALIIWLDGRHKGEASVGAIEVAPAVDPEPKPKPSAGPSRPAEARPRPGGGTSRSPQASRQRGKKRRRR